MATNNIKHITTYEIVYIMQLFFFSHATFLSTSQVSVVFNISSSHANNNLPNIRFLLEQFSKPKYKSILHALLHSQSHVPRF